MIPLPGYNINGINDYVKRNIKNLSSFGTVLIHVGTNDINNKSEQDILTDYQNLIITIKEVLKPDNVILSSILPRPVDFLQSIHSIVYINKALQSLTKKHGVMFLYTFSSYMKNQFVKRQLFAVRDGGLHLNQKGTKILKSRFCQCLSSIYKNRKPKYQTKAIKFQFYQIPTVVSDRTEKVISQKQTVNLCNLVEII